MTISNDEPKRKNWIVPVVSVASIIWLCFWGLLFSVSAPCSEALAGFLETRVICLRANEMGDSLAGAFAPLAFLWLIAAIFLQKSELEEQRKELGYTRREYQLTRSEVKAQREAMQAQAAEARRNVEYIGEQTAILRAGREKQEESEKDERILGLIKILSERLWDFAGPVMEAEIEGVSRAHLHLSSVDGSLDMFKIVGEYAGEIESSISSFEDSFSDHSIRKILRSAEDLAYIVAAAYEIDELREGCSLSMMDRLDHAEWWKLNGQLDRLASMLCSSSVVWAQEYKRGLDQRGYAKNN